MNGASRKIQAVYLTLMLLNTLAASLIWGINTLFLLDAGLNNTEAFSANAFFTAGQVLFDVPTGAVADIRGRRFSYLLGTVTLGVSTFLYLILWEIHAAFWAWAIVSVLLGLGFTFFSGAIEAWLVDALNATGFEGAFESVFAKGQIVEGIGMLFGSLAGGFIAQYSSLGIPYILRIGSFVVAFLVAFFLMKDVGFTRKKQAVWRGLKEVWHNSVKYGLGSTPIRWIMLEGFFTGAVMIYAFYAMQPYLLKLYGDEKAYGIAGLAAAIIAAAQIVGGFLVPYIRKFFKRRTTILFLCTCFGAISLLLIGLFPQFWLVIVFLVFFGLLFAVATPVRQTFVNSLIPSEQRATVLSFDSVLSSSGAVVSQPILGKVADVWGYPASYIGSTAIQILALPFIWLARRKKVDSDFI